MPATAGLAAWVNGREAMGPVIPVAPAGMRCLSVTAARAEKGPAASRAAPEAPAGDCTATPDRMG